MKHKSKGQQKSSFQSFILALWHEWGFSQMVSVASDVAVSDIVFDFTKSIRSAFNISGKTDTSVKAYAQLLSKVVGQISNSDLIAAFKSAGIITKDNQSGAENIVNQIKEDINRKLLVTGISQSYMATVLSSTEWNREAITQSEINAKSIFDAVALTQLIYSKYANRVSAEEVVAILHQAMTSTPLYSTVTMIMKALRRDSGPTVSIRLAHALNQVRTAVKSGPYVTYDTLLPGVLHRVSSNTFPEEVAFGEAVTSFMLVVRGIMGYASTDKVDSVNFNDMVTSMAIGDNAVDTRLPDELKTTDMTKCHTLLCEMFFLFLSKRMITGEVGSTKTRIESMLEKGKYGRDAAVANFLYDSVNALSVIYESWLDTGAFMRELVYGEHVYFSDIHPAKRRKYVKFFDTYWNALKATQLSLDNPRYLNEPAHVFMQSVPLAAATKISTFYSDKVFSSVRPVLTMPDFDAIAYLKTEVISGDPASEPGILDVDIRALTVASDYVPSYGISLPAPALLTTDLFLARTRIFELSKTAKTGWARHLIGMGKLVYIADALDYAKTFEIPQEVGNRLFKNAGLYLDCRDSSNITILWPRDTALEYEVWMPEGSDPTLLDDKGLANAKIPPFVARWPFLVEIDIASTETLFKKARPGKSLDSPFSKKKKEEDEAVDDPEEKPKDNEEGGSGGGGTE